MGKVGGRQLAKVLRSEVWGVDLSFDDDGSGAVGSKLVGQGAR